MAGVKSTGRITVNIQLDLTEAEARALKELTVFGTDTFLETFYAGLGKSTLHAQEEGLRSLFETIKKELPQHLNRADQARRALEK